MKRHLLTYGVLASCVLLAGDIGVAYGMRAVFQERLANFAGVVQSLWPRVAVDQERNEAFALDQRERVIRIFNEHGMEIFSLGENVELSGATDIDIGADGDIYVVFPRSEKRKIMRLDYKGSPLADIDLVDFPEDFQALNPDFIQYKDGLLYLADSYSMDVVVTDSNGLFQKGFHLKPELWKMRDDYIGRPGEKEFSSTDMFASVNMHGFWVDHEDSIFVTVPVLFTAFKLQANGEMEGFGVAGGAPGKFGVIGGICTDRKGNIYVADRLRSVVLIFDRSLKFQTEFGYRGPRPSSLVGPDDLAFNDGMGIVYVSQAANRGVSTFRIVEDIQAGDIQAETVE